MKKLKSIALLLAMLTIFSNLKIYGQASSGNNNNTPFTAQDYIGWRLGVLGTGFLTVPELTIKNEDPMPISFYTNAGGGTFNNIKMSIMSRTINGLERAGVAIHEGGFSSQITLPRSILHLGEDYFTNGIAGWRTWMDIGTFSGLQTDFAFFGIMPFDGDTAYGQDDHNDAVIVWGDNVNPANDGADNLRIIFSAPMRQTTGDWSTQYSSLEVARFDPLGRFGIGNFTANAWGGGSGIQPARRLEIYDESLNRTLTAAPQLRLTFSPAAAANLTTTGIWTDFQTTHLGDLFINTQTATTLRNVGIQDNRPNYTLEVTGTGAFSNASSYTILSGGFPMVSQSHPLVVKSNSKDEGLSILREGTATTGYDDGWRLFQDRNELSHFRTIGTSSGGTNVNHNITFDHLATTSATTASSWLGYHSGRFVTVIKTDFNSNPAFSSHVSLTPWTKLFVEAQNNSSAYNREQFAIIARNSNSSYNYLNMTGLYAEAVGTYAAGNGRGNIAGSFYASNATGSRAFNKGVYSEVTGNTTNSQNYGGDFRTTAVTSGNNFGVYAMARNATAANYGVYSSVTSTGNNFSGWFGGDMYHSGAFAGPSDTLLKTGITDFTNPRSIIERLLPKSFYFNTSTYSYLSLPAGLQYGLLAQQLDTVLPQFVKNIHYPGETDTSGNYIYDTLNFKAIDYTALIPILFAHAKQQYLINDSLRNQLDTLQQIVNNCCNLRQQGENGSSSKNKYSVALSNLDFIVLNQNEPNPFNDQTTIKWSIPESSKKDVLDAKLMFFDKNGSVLKVIKIEDTGTGELLVFANNLSNGMYNYSLYVNGKVIDTKRMIKAK